MGHLLSFSIRFSIELFVTLLILFYVIGFHFYSLFFKEKNKFSFKEKISSIFTVFLIE